jgi:ribonuclease HI
MAIKYYVVWKGREPGVYDNWEACKRQVEGFKSPLYKAFVSLPAAEEAFRKGSQDYLKSKDHPMQMIFDALYGSPIIPSIAVDGACSGKTKQAEYQEWIPKPNNVYFIGSFSEGTNNLMEFLAWYMLWRIANVIIWMCLFYTDSATAMKW